MSSVRRAALLAAAVLALPPAAPAASMDAPAAARFSPSTDSRLAVKLEAAAEYIHDEDWPKAVRVLQQVLDVDRDFVVEVGGAKEPRTVSARAEALRLVAALPPAGRKAYQEAEGPAAADLLKEATQDEDDEKMTAVVRRFLYTDSGPAALEALARLHYAAGRYRLAALSYQRLLELRDAAKWPPEALLRAADVFHRFGDKARAHAVGKQLLDRLGADGLPIGGRKWMRATLQNELNEPVQASGDWPLFGGDPGRTAEGEGATPLLNRIWQTPTTVASSVDHADFAGRLDDLFKRASDRLAQANEAILPPQFLVTATVTMKKDGARHWLVVYRTHTGIAACDIWGGKMQGWRPVPGSFDWMMNPDPARQGRATAFTQWAEAYVDQNKQPGILLENTTIGTLSIDGHFAYTVEDLAVPPPPAFLKPGLLGEKNPFGWSQDIFDAIGHSRLMAYDLSTGCEGAWDEKLFDDPKSDLGGGFFLGPPLPLDSRLFVLHEKQGELRLLCPENAPGKAQGTYQPRIVFLLPLGTVPDELSAKNTPRRLHAAHLAYADGVLVCPTNAGAVVGVDLLTRSVVWVHRYEQAPLPAAPGGFVVLGLPAPVAAAVPGWRNGAPAVSGDAVLLAAPDAVDLSCLDLKTGALRWKRPRRDDDLYLAGVFAGRALVVGKKSCTAYNLSDGEPLWTVATGVPSGWGAAAGGVYYLPLRETDASKEPEVCAIDLAKGEVVGHSKTPEGKEKIIPGNLVFSGGILITQTLDQVVAYPLQAAKPKEEDSGPNAPDKEKPPGR